MSFQANNFKVFKMLKAFKMLKTFKVHKISLS